MASVNDRELGVALTTFMTQVIGYPLWWTIANVGSVDFGFEFIRRFHCLEVA
jgi:hypothetical protein